MEQHYTWKDLPDSSLVLLEQVLSQKCGMDSSAWASDLNAVNWALGRMSIHREVKSELDRRRRGDQSFSAPSP